MLTMTTPRPATTIHVAAPSETCRDWQVFGGYEEASGRYRFAALTFAAESDARRYADCLLSRHAGAAAEN
jgi:hypothetical protein